MNLNPEITDLKIQVVPRQGIKKPILIAKCQATFNHAFTIPVRIVEGRKGIYCIFPKIFVMTKEFRKEASNRCLATYVINHCTDTSRTMGGN